MSSIFRRFRLALEGTTPSRRLQEEVDTGWVALLTEFRKLSEAKHSKTKDELLSEASALMKKKSFKEQKAQIQAEISTRLEEIFNSYSSRPMHWDSVGSNKARLSISGFSRKHLVKEDSLKDDLLGFRLSVEQSNVVKAGDGVKLYGKVLPGSLVALYPGTVYLPEHYKKPELLEHISNNPYARGRFDSIVINGRNQTQNPRNPFAVGHMINHPPANELPNVIAFPYDFPMREPFTKEEHIPLIPNSFIDQPSRLTMFGKRILIHSMAFISLREIEDEELFLNYRYNPNLPYPEWYTPVDLESDQLLWG